MKDSKHIVDLRTHMQGGVRASQPYSTQEVFQKEPKAVSKKELQVIRSSRKSNFWNHTYRVISYFGWALSVVFNFIKLVLRSVKLVLLSPIKLLDSLLDLLLALVKKTPSYLWQQLLTGLRRLGFLFKNFHTKPTVLWGKALATFAALALIMTLPIKFFQPVRDLTSAPARVLGASTDALQMLSLATSFREYVPVALVGSELLGFEQPKRLLIIFQNNRELRATGGFMGSYALIDVADGEITNIDVPGGGFYDLKASQIGFVEAPRPFRVFAPYWQIWNANWFADFPTSAEKLLRFYDQHGGPTVDGVIALTPNLVEDLLRVTGPIELEQYGQIINAENFVRETQIEVEFEYDKVINTPKAFIGDLLPVFFERLLAQLAEGKTQEILEAVDKAFEERHLLVYSTNPLTQRSVEKLGWAGEIVQVQGDYLQIVHNNTGGGKTDVVIKDSVKDTIELTPYGSAIHKVDLTRFHGGDTEDIFEGHDNLDYVRFYVPADARLLEASGFTKEPNDRFEEVDRPIEKDPDLALSDNTWSVDANSGMHIFTESDMTVFGNWIGLKPGQTKTVTLTYEVIPSHLTKGGDGGGSEPLRSSTGASRRSPLLSKERGSYTMYYQKQAGVQGAKLDVVLKTPVTLPIVDYAPDTPNLVKESQNLMRYNNDLRIDRWLRIGL